MIKIIILTLLLALASETVYASGYVDIVHALMSMAKAQKQENKITACGILITAYDIDSVFKEKCREILTKAVKKR
ncbi:hypothetical protein IID24_03075 [Patescibacteria group bacterium]|nr:hypothetical protein [Patescibacteria group bacterium]